MTPENIATLDQAMDDAGVRHTTELYEGAQHGYTMSDMGAYNEAAAERTSRRYSRSFNEQSRGEQQSPAQRGRDGGARGQPARPTPDLAPGVLSVPSTPAADALATDQPDRPHGRTPVSGQR